MDTLDTAANLAAVESAVAGVLYAVRIDAVLARVPEIDQLRTGWLFYAVAMLVFVVGVALVLIGNSRGKK